MASRKDSEGRACRGSQCQMQLYVNVPARRMELDEAALAVLPDLTAAGGVRFRWRSPLWSPLFATDKRFHEYRDGKMRREVIGQRLRETRTWLGVRESQQTADMWLGELYQLANRLAYLRWFREVLDPPIPTWLLNVYFVRDKTFKPTQKGEWDAELKKAEGDLGLVSPVACSSRVFLPGRERDELVQATPRLSLP